jgi:TRAP transporter 4TM/12TM fusion protein
MGAAAFVMAEFTGVSYLKIIFHAFLPAMLYFLAVGAMVHFEACRLGLIHMEGNRKQSAALTQLISQGYKLIPIAVIVAFLVIGYSAIMAAFSGVVSVVVIGLFVKETRRNFFNNILRSLNLGGQACLPVSAACACAGVAIGMITLTGIGLKLTSLIVYVSQGNLFLALFMTALCGMVLGMGLPTTPTYIIMSALLAPAMMKLGVNMIAAHFFIFYYGILAVITPPVAVASYTASGMAESRIMPTALNAMKLGITAYIVPFMFAYAPQLLLIGSPGKVVLSIITSVTGVIFLAAAAEGWLMKRLHIIQRIVLLPGALILIFPGFLTDTIGMVVCFGMLGMQYLFRTSFTLERGTRPE